MGAIMPILSFGFKAFSAISSFSAQNAAAEAQAQQQAEYARQRNEALKIQQESARLRQQQEEEGQARERFKVGLEADRAQGTARAAAAGAGISGRTVDSLLQDFDFQTQFFNEGSYRQEEFIGQQADIQTRANAQQSSFDIFANSPPIEKPSFAGAALRIGQSALSLFS